MASVFSTPVHPGEILREEFLAPHGLSAGRLAKALDVPRTRIERIIKEEVGITTDTALRLAKFFDTSPEVWMNLQQAYELSVSAAVLEGELARIQPLVAANDDFAEGRKAL